jgi:toxin ParE1/3/4
VKLEWTDIAQADRDSIYDYIEADNPRAALVLDDRFRNLAARLTRFPRMGRPGRVEGTREFVAHKNYVLVYEIDGETLRILRALHTSRLWPPE